MSPNTSSSPRIADHFASLTDPRRKAVTHPLINIISIALRATIAGADDLVAMVAWAKQHQEWLARFLDLVRDVDPEPLGDRELAALAARRQLQRGSEPDL